ncbi:hypothetical protein [Rhizobium sp. AG855]|uniref:hypothetical protein n=1 Tax=Rhizobium sp. AG855 TaxID=2183898 RepID=UPI000E765213|nr:hypothetical protein [Rhizobium sp. AG855]RKE84077.1 hypothetical protein DFO46_0838 [Rhizobium sp. AG855]
MFKAIVLCGMLVVAGSALAEERIVTIDGGQISVPVGLTVQVKSVTLGDDATRIRLLASFDSHVTNFVELNGGENAYLRWGDALEQRLHMRQVGDNKWMRVVNGETMEGDLVFPGKIPGDAGRLTLVFNEGKPADDADAPGVTIPLEIRP